MQSRTDGHEEAIMELEARIERLKFNPASVLKDGGQAIMHLSKAAEKTKNDDIIKILNEFSDVMRDPKDAEVTEEIYNLQQEIVKINQEYKST